MRKTLSVITVLIAVVFLFAGCGKNTKLTLNVEPPVTMEQVNTESHFVARAYLESLFLGDEEMFNKCYPDGFIKTLNEVNNVNVFERYREATKINGEIVGTVNVGYVDFTIANGFDEPGMRSRICHVTGLEYTDIGQIRIQKITACFTNGVETVNSDFSYYVYEVNGNWYMLEGVVNSADN